MINFEQAQGHFVAGPCLYPIQRKTVFENGLELLLPRIVELVSRRIGDKLVSASFQNSVVYRPKVVLSMYVKALTTHNWDMLKACLRKLLSCEVVIMFVSVTEAQGADNQMTFL
jgi:hypothetical protein